ncbi:hypothetical protein NQ315_012241 [Exocentrus adspersus]|uniref:Uncharacterized protein n=1 Tax=Exocentrus adspersus TaxID=1586481 RepID=A0AAV8V5P4_9CUCU|nr:hypothetical protein NQ315_012241 [Exocentrus adspersus]
MKNNPLCSPKITIVILYLRIFLPRMCKWRYRCCGCSSKTFGFLYGWMGVIWRTVFTMFLAVTLTKTSPYDPNIYDIGLITVLGYVQVSLVANLFFIVGIQKEKPYFMLPFVVIGGMEIFAGIIIFCIGTVYLHASRRGYLLWGTIPMGLIVIGVYIYFWIKSIRLYNEIEIDLTKKKEENARIASIRQSLGNH